LCFIKGYLNQDLSSDTCLSLHNEQSEGIKPMKTLFTRDTLEQENRRYRNTGGVSAVNRSQRFIPAFCDSATGQAYRSRFADGRPAPIHLLDGLPESLVLERTSEGLVTAAKGSVIAGFLREGQFYTREQAAVDLA
jgi:hypothetical protein